VVVSISLISVYSKNHAPRSRQSN